MIAPSTPSSAPTRVGNMAGPMRCMSPSRYCCARSTKPPPIAMKISPAQKSFGERMRIDQGDATGLMLRSPRGGRLEAWGRLILRDRRSRTLLRMRWISVSVVIAGGTESIRPDVRLLDDRAEAFRLLLHARVQLRRARRDGVDPAAGEALLHVGHVEDLDHLGVELVDDRLRRPLGRKQRGPVGRVDLFHAFLLQRRPFRIERRTLAHRYRQHADASALDMRGDRGARQYAERNVARRQRSRGRRAALVGDMLETGAGI